ncbi:HU family DNA-binding protein [Neomoorella mulderi]|uniref:Bacterial DNA-binding protein n=1 Tax=Moorella mulderi DSM 14980 TaxID=1122241 RepID=A0A151ASV8_9FIRM|nr:HU family DNA-binding protein [Moorella mulderi]KYH30663.1 bacterial DNA-binding protein [Moorella mulderi DSM 14980]
MLTKEIINETAKRMGCYRKDARELLLQHFVSVLTEAAVRGEKVHLAGLGTFYPARSRKPRKDGIRQTVLKFKAAKPLLRRINPNDGGELK